MTSLLPEQVAVLLREAFPTAIEQDFDIQPTTGGFSNLTLALRLPDQPAIVKIASRPAKRADLRNEAMILHLLADHHLPVVPLIRLIEDQHWSVEILARLPGFNALQLLTNELAIIELLFTRLGQLLAQIHGLPLSAPTSADLLAERQRLVIKQLQMLALPPTLYQPLQRGLIDSIDSQATPCLIHGDPGAHNLLWHEQQLALLDWEWAAWGDPAIDLAWVIWTTHFRQLPQSVRAAFWAGYNMPQPEPELLTNLAYAQIAAILVRVADQPPAYQEWLRRLEWTLHLQWAT